MATNIELNENLVRKAMDLADLKTKKDAVNQALQEFVERREQLKVIDLFDSIDESDTFDHKSQRTRL